MKAISLDRCCIQVYALYFPGMKLCRREILLFTFLWLFAKSYSLLWNIISLMVILIMTFTLPMYYLYISLKF